MRIQNEISEIEKREIEFKTQHSNISSGHRLSFDEDAKSNDEYRSPSPQSICSKDHFKKNKIIEPQPKPQILVPPVLTRAASQPQLFLASPVKISSPHRGIMQKFIASRGKLNVSQVNQPVQNNNFKKNLIMVCCKIILSMKEKLWSNKSICRHQLNSIMTVLKLCKI
jgi:hypothetical protein